MFGTDHHSSPWWGPRGTQLVASPTSDTHRNPKRKKTLLFVERERKKGNPFRERKRKGYFRAQTQTIHLCKSPPLAHLSPSSPLTSPSIPHFPPQSTISDIPLIDEINPSFSSIQVNHFFEFYSISLLGVNWIA